MATLETVEETETFAQELADRFGAPPPAAEHLLFAVRVRALARLAGATAIQQDSDTLIVQATEDVAPRDRLRHLQIEGLWTGPTQARLDLTALGERWQEALLDVLGALADHSAQPAFATAES